MCLYHVYTGTYMHQIACNKERQKWHYAMGEEGDLS